MNERDSVPADTESRCQKIFVAIELSKAKWIVVIRAPHVDKSSLFEVVGGDVDRLLVLIERARKQGFKVTEVCTCYEAGYDGFWLHRYSIIGTEQYEWKQWPEPKKPVDWRPHTSIALVYCRSR